MGEYVPHCYWKQNDFSHWQISQAIIYIKE